MQTQDINPLCTKNMSKPFVQTQDNPLCDNPLCTLNPLCTKK